MQVVGHPGNPNKTVPLAEPPEVREFRGKCCGAADDPVPESEQDIAYRLIEVPTPWKLGEAVESVGQTMPFLPPMTGNGKHTT